MSLSSVRRFEFCPNPRLNVFLKRLHSLRNGIGISGLQQVDQVSCNNRGLFFRDVVDVAQDRKRLQVCSCAAGNMASSIIEAPKPFRLPPGRISFPAACRRMGGRRSESGKLSFDILRSDLESENEIGSFDTTRSHVESVFGPPRKQAAHQDNESHNECGCQNPIRSKKTAAGFRRRRAFGCLCIHCCLVFRPDGFPEVEPDSMIRVCCHQTTRSEFDKGISCREPLPLFFVA